MARVIVIGAGVVGLSCAVRLVEGGHQVSVVARDLPLETTSATVAALWYPYRAYPFERVTAWAATTYTALTALAQDEKTGVFLRLGTEAFRSGPAPSPCWASAVPELRPAASLPSGFAAGLS